MQISALAIQNANKVSTRFVLLSLSLSLTLTLFCSVSSACQTICASAQEELETNNKYTHNATSISCVSQLFVYLLAKNNRATETPFPRLPTLPQILSLQLLYPSLFAFAGCVACCVLGEYSLIDFANVAF